jgi:hypothetical protein
MAASESASWRRCHGCPGLVPLPPGACDRGNGDQRRGRGGDANDLAIAENGPLVHENSLFWSETNVLKHCSRGAQYHFQPAPAMAATATRVEADAAIRTTLLLLKTVHLSMRFLLSDLNRMFVFGVLKPTGSVPLPAGARDRGDGHESRGGCGDTNNLAVAEDGPLVHGDSSFRSRRWTRHQPPLLSSRTLRVSGCSYFPSSVVWAAGRNL